MRLGDRLQEGPGPRMSLGEHLQELRSRLINSLVVLALALVVAMVFYEGLAYSIAWPHQWAMDLLGVPPAQRVFLSKGPADPAIATLKLVFIVALFASAPFVAGQLWGFVSAGLYPHEKKYVVVFAPISFLLFAGGCAFGFSVLVPACLYGMAKWLDPKLVAPIYNFSDYLGLVLTLTLLVGAAFQLPLVMVFLAKIGVIRPPTYRRWRRSAILGNAVVAAVLSPPDLVSMIAFAVPLQVLYEVGVWTSHFLTPAARG